VIRVQFSQTMVLKNDRDKVAHLGEHCNARRNSIQNLQLAGHLNRWILQNFA
jgi:hypothetical protein